MSRLVRVASVGEIPVGRGKSVEVDGVLLGDSIVCPWHGFDFDVRTGACDVAPDLSVTVYPVRITGSDVLVELP